MYTNIKYHGFSKKDLDLPFRSLIISALVFGIEVWECTLKNECVTKHTKVCFLTH